MQNRTERRRAALLIVAAVAGFAPTMPAGASTGKDEAEIRAVWANYEKHLQAKQGDELALLLASPAIAYYGRMKRLALTGTPEAVAKAGMLMRLSVYTVRHLATATELKAMDTRKFIAWNVNLGLVSTMGKHKVELVNIRVNGDRAEAAIRAGASTSPPLFDFIREGGAWKIDVVKAVRVMEPLIQSRLSEAGLSEEQILAIMIRPYSTKPYRFEDLKKPLVTQ